MKNLLVLGAACGALGLALAGCGGSSNNNGINSGTTFLQTDRLARPVVNEVFATFANGRHDANDTDNPSDDKNQLANDIQGFMTTAAKRKQTTTDVVKAVLVPDVMVADLSVSNSGGAAYLGIETGGVTGSKFGGRALKDDVVDRSLGIIFGNTLFEIGAAPDDRATATPNLTTDNVGAHTYLSTFPYLNESH